MVGFAHDDGFPEGGKKVVEFVYPWQEWQKVWMSEEKKKICRHREEGSSVAKDGYPGSEVR